MDEKLRKILNQPVIIHNELVDELTGVDYLNTSLGDLMSHPDFSPKALETMATVIKMTSAQLESLNIEGKTNA